MDVLKVSAKSNPNSVAGALAGVLREEGKAELQAIGAGALNQAIKAIAIARGFVAPHEVEFDRILVDELKKQGHTPCFFVPKRFPFKINYGVEIEYLEGGEVVTYAGVGELKKLLLSIVREKRRIDWFNAAYAKAKAGKCDAIIVPTSTYRYLRTLCNSKLKHSPVPIYFIFHARAFYILPSLYIMSYVYFRRLHYQCCS